MLEDGEEEAEEEEEEQQHAPPPPAVSDDEEEMGGAAGGDEVDAALADVGLRAIHVSEWRHAASAGDRARVVNNGALAGSWLVVHGMMTPPYHVSFPDPGRGHPPNHLAFVKVA